MIFSYEQYVAGEESGSDKEDDDDEEVTNEPVDWKIKAPSAEPKTKGVLEHYATENYRLQEVPLNLFAKTDFKKNKKALEKAASLMVEDNTTRYHLGLVIPLNADADYRGQ